MAHELEIVNGNANMAYVGAKPWHGLGKEVSPDLGYQYIPFMEAAGMNHEHRLVQLVTETSPQIKVDRYAVVRDDNKVIGTVGARYNILQNVEAFEWFKDFLEAKEASLNTAGTLKEGAVIWVLAKLNKNPLEIAKDDLVEKFLLLSHSHDGSLSVRVGFTPIRVLCANTLAMAHGKDASKLIKVKHSKNVLYNLDNIRGTMNLANQEFEATAQQYRMLARKSINQKDLQKYVKLVFAKQNPALTQVTDEQIGWFKEDRTEEQKDMISTRLKHTLEEVFELVHTGKGNDLPSIQGTYWQAYQGVAEYLSYQNGRTDDSRMTSLWYGQGADLNKHALDVAVELALAA